MFKIGIIGLGSIGFRHLKNILTEIPIKKVWVFDIDKSLCVNKIKKLENDKVDCVEDIENILDKNVDIVFICSPNVYHFQHALVFIEHGIPLFIEKPVTIYSKDCVILKEKAKAPIFVGCNMRYHPAIKKAKEVIKLNLLGKIVSANAFYGHDLKNWRSGVDYRNTYSAKKEMGGGILLDGVHELDYLIWLFGEVKKGYCSYMHSGLLEIETEDVAKIILFYEMEILSTISLDYIQPFKRRGLEIVGSKGTFIWESRGKSPELVRIELLTRDKQKVLQENSFNDLNVCYIEEIREIFEVLSGKDISNTNLLRIGEACKTIDIIECFKECGYYERNNAL